MERRELQWDEVQLSVRVATSRSHGMPVRGAPSLLIGHIELTSDVIQMTSQHFTFAHVSK
jgi:hypothetical protein